MVFRKNPSTMGTLRELAAQRMSGRLKADSSALTKAEAQSLFNELEIHQIELEMQNEHLEAARASLQSALNQGSELYDFLPVGCVSINALGVIKKLNLTCAKLFGQERARLLGTRLALQFPENQRLTFDTLLQQAKASEELQVGDLSLQGIGGTVVHIRVRVTPLTLDTGWQLVLSDVTDQRQADQALRTNEQRLKLALDAAGDGMWEWDLGIGRILVSTSYGQVFGFAEGEFGGMIGDWSQRLHPDDQQRVTQRMQACLEGRTANYSSEHRARCKDGSWKWVHDRGTVVSRDDNGKPVRLVGTIIDITQRKSAEEALASAAKFQQAVFDSVGAHLLVLDHQGTVVLMNAAFRKYALEQKLNEQSCFQAGDYLGMLDRLCGQDHEAVEQVRAGIATVVDGKEADFQLARPFFEPVGQRWFSMRAMPVHDAAGQIVISHEDVTELKAAELASRTMANIDALTGSLSRRHFLTLAEQELARAWRYQLPLVILMLDLDHFKTINDRFGHSAGDAVLQRFVQVVSGVLRESDLIGRIGGEEFAVLLPSTTLEGGRALAQRIVDAVRASPVAHGSEIIVCTVSAGAACLAEETDLGALLERADAALYRAKHAGRDCIVMS